MRQIAVTTQDLIATNVQQKRNKFVEGRGAYPAGEPPAASGWPRCLNCH
jgi:hypothetical protein